MISPFTIPVLFFFTGTHMDYHKPSDDADKINYANYYDLIFDKVRPGGFIVADNVLWSGKVLEAKQDKDTQAINAFNKKVYNDPRVETTLLPVRDGLMLIWKRLM